MALDTLGEGVQELILGNQALKLILRKIPLVLWVFNFLQQEPKMNKMNKKEAIKATKFGAIAAGISAAFTLSIALIAIKSHSTGTLARFNDPTIFLDVVLMFGLAFGMYKKSRTASILVFFYVLVSKSLMWLETKSFSGIGMTAVFLYLYGNAIRGAFAYHKLEKEENPNYKAVTKWTYILTIPSALLVVALLGLAIVSASGFIPSTRVKSGNEITAEETSTLRSQGIVSANEKIDFFYPSDSSILKGGIILTEQRVIYYLTEEGKGTRVYGIPINEITGIDLEVKGNSFKDSIYKIKTKDPDRWLKISLSPEKNGDEKLINALRDRIPQ